jgi:hypothetical protein
MSLADGLARNFAGLGDGRYRLTIPDIGIEFDCDRLRRDRHELIGELSVKCGLAGARTFQGVLSVGDLNFSSVRARSDRARVLGGAARTKDLDWHGLIEEFVQRVLAAERVGLPSVSLRDVPLPDAEDHLEVAGLFLPRRHPSILFGDGGSAKSLIGLHVATELEAIS